MREILIYFLKQGLFCFGGPLAMISVFQKDLSGDGKWITTDRFSRLIALIKALPGPISTQLGIRIAAIRGGTVVGCLAGILLITPAFILMVLLAHFHPLMQNFTVSRFVLIGMQAASIGVIAEGILRLAKPNLKTPVFIVIAALSLSLNVFYPQYEPVIIIGFGILGILLTDKTRFTLTLTSIMLLFSCVIFPAVAGPATAGSTATINSLLLSLPTELQLFFVFFKAGALTFGTGLAIIPLLSHDVVETLKWLSPREFMDGLAFGQITPGPVVITATFIGYKVLGLKGALISTFGMFLPAFFNILVWFPFAERKFENSTKAKNFVLFAIAAVTGALLMAVLRLLGTNVAVHNPEIQIPAFFLNHGVYYAIAGFAFFLALKNKVGTLFIIPTGGLIALVFSLIQRALMVS